MRRGVFPGSFDPLTVGHLAVAEAAHRQLALASVTCVLSTVALDKEAGSSLPLAERVQQFDRLGASHPWLSVETTDHQLLADIAEPYDVLVIGADKWFQLHEERYYASADAMNAALRRLPHVAVAPRDGHGPSELTRLTGGKAVTVLDVTPEVRHVSSTKVRDGAHHWSV